MIVGILNKYPNNKVREKIIMKNKYFCYGILGVLLIVVICSIRSFHENKLNDWIGEYNYVAIFPREDNELPNYVINYDIKIYEQDKEYYAMISNDGWFTQTRTLAYVIGDRHTIEIRFVETLPEDSLYGSAERYESEEILLKLTQNDAGLQTDWGVLREEHPTYSTTEDEIIGVFFEKIK